MNVLKATSHSARFLARRGAVSNLKAVNKSRFYSATPAHGAAPKKESSNTPWAIGSLIIFGPLLFHLTSPPPKKKKQLEHVEHVASVAPVAKPQPVEEKQEEKPVAVKKVQKPYVLVGAGTASFAAAQAIKEKDPEANVKYDIFFVSR